MGTWTNIITRTYEEDVFVGKVKWLKLLRK